MLVFSDYGGGLKWRGFVSKKELWKRWKVDEVLFEDLLVVMVLFWLEMELCVVVLVFRLESVFFERIKLEVEKKSCKKKFLVFFLLLLV